MARERRKNAGRGETEDSGVPRVRGRRDVRARLVDRRFFDETLDARRGRRSTVDDRAALEIAESRFGMRRSNAERDEQAVTGEPDGPLDGDAKRGLIADQVVRRHHKQDRIVAVRRAHDHRGERHRRRSVATEGLEQERVAIRPVGPKRGVDVARVEIQIAIGDGDDVRHARQRTRTRRSLAEQGFTVGEAHERLGRHFARQRPQPRAGAA